jgi:hypothetical protein
LEHVLVGRNKGSFRHPKGQPCIPLLANG